MQTNIKKNATELALNVWPLLRLQGFEFWCFMLIPGLIEATARKRIDLAMQSKMANLMLGVRP